MSTESTTLTLDQKVELLLAEFKRTQGDLKPTKKGSENQSDIDARIMTLTAPEINLTVLLSKDYLRNEFGLMITAVYVKRSGANTVATFHAREAFK